MFGISKWFGKALQEALDTMVELTSSAKATRTITDIVVHCSATREGQHFDADDIRKWHTSPPRNWSDIGYHYVILLDGTEELGRPESIPGAHVRGHNKNTIGIVYIGGVETDGKTPKDTRTDAQKKAIRRRVKALQARYPNARVRGHRDFPGVAKACPSFSVADEL